MGYATAGLLDYFCFLCPTPLSSFAPVPQPTAQYQYPQTVVFCSSSTLPLPSLSLHQQDPRYFLRRWRISHGFALASRLLSLQSMQQQGSPHASARIPGSNQPDSPRWLFVHSMLYLVISCYGKEVNATYTSQENIVESSGAPRDSLRRGRSW